MKMPQARAKAADASLPTLVDEGRLFLRMRRTQARGGSNSTADGGGGVATDLSVEAAVVGAAEAAGADAAATAVVSVASIAVVASVASVGSLMVLGYVV